MRGAPVRRGEEWGSVAATQQASDGKDSPMLERADRDLPAFAADAVDAPIRIGDQTIHVGDCAGILAGLPEASVDVVVTSPPYNIGVKYRSYDDSGDRAGYLAWLGKIGGLVKRALKDDGSFFLNVAGTSSDPWVAWEAAAQMRRHFALQNAIVWVKSVSIGDDTHGHFKPVNSRRYLNHTHEHVFHLTKAGDVALDRLAAGVPFKDKSNIARWGHDRDRRCAGDVWFIPYETIRTKAARHHHPSPFPTALAERCIKLHGRPQAIVLDPFLGIGSTLVAAQRLGCRGIGIEIDPAYAQAAAWRLRERLI
jgi:site-specific DNA-methyltransferase (adenine-specific)